MKSIKIEESWKKILSSEFEKEYWQELTSFVKHEYAHKKIYPPGKQLFRAFELCPFEKVKVVILGQDPYHGTGQAHGLCFSVAPGTKLPPSLQNIYKEIQVDMSAPPVHSAGDLSGWAQQGVLLLNSVLTVEAGKPASHKGKGWELFTDAVISALSAHKKNVVYLLWGKYAQQKGVRINAQHNLVLQSGHPSPFSAQLFHGNHHFSQCNTYLEKNNQTGIVW